MRTRTVVTTLILISTAIVVVGTTLTKRRPTAGASSAPGAVAGRSTAPGAPSTIERVRQRPPQDVERSQPPPPKFVGGAGPSTVSVARSLPDPSIPQFAELGLTLEQETLVRDSRETQSVEFKAARDRFKEDGDRVSFMASLREAKRQHQSRLVEILGEQKAKEVHDLVMKRGAAGAQAEMQQFSEASRSPQPPSQRNQ
jgi:hypothetical protein